MRHPPLQALLLLALLFFGGAPSAAPYLAINLDVRCSQVVSNSDANHAWRDLYGMWLLGFFTGMNRADATQVGASTDAMGIWRALYNHCEAYPRSDFTEAAVVVYERMASRP